MRAGSVKAIAVGAKHRLPSVPDTPTAEESGLAGFAFANWVGIFAPKGTPKDIVSKLNSAVMSTLADPGIRQRLVELGVEIPSRDQQTPEGFAALQKADIEQGGQSSRRRVSRGSETCDPYSNISRSANLISSSLTRCLSKRQGSFICDRLTTG